MKITWVTLSVSDIKKSIAFYTEVFGMQVVSRFHGGIHEIAMLKTKNEVLIELIQNRREADKEVGNGVSIGLEIENLDAFVALLLKNGYELTGPIAPNPTICFYFIKDPDGYTLQLLKRS